MTDAPHAAVSERNGYRWTIPPAGEGGERPVVSVVPVPGAEDGGVATAIAQRGLDVRRIGSSCRSEGKWWELVFDERGGWLAGLREVVGARTEGEAVAALTASYRERLEMYAAADAEAIEARLRYDRKG